jgi:hypothetical protein
MHQRTDNTLTDVEARVWIADVGDLEESAWGNLELDRVCPKGAALNPATSVLEIKVVFSSISTD